MTTPVTINVISDDPSPVAVSGVVINVYDLSAVFQTSGTTDGSGNVNIMLPDATYNVLLYKVGVVILPRQPQQIVVDHTQSNNFQVTAHIPSRPESTDPRRCTISGYVLGVDGLPDTHRLIFETKEDLLVLSGNVIAPYHRREVASDQNGYFQFELLRATQYEAYFLFPQELFNMQPGRLFIETPDAASVNLSDLLFPIPINLTFSASTISLVAGGLPDDSITYGIASSDGNVHTITGTPWAGVAITNTNGLVVTTALVDGKIILTPMSPGTAVITTVREMPSIVVFDPLPTYTSDTVTVTVT
jgi:hypothetical protein